MDAAQRREAAEPELLLACVSENDEHWLERVRDLIRSVRWFGGSLAAARFIVNVVGEPPRGEQDAIADLGAEVRVVAPFDRRSPYTNKLRMLELSEEAAFDILVCLDCDVVVVDDFALRIPADAVGAKPVEYDLFTEAEWQQMFGAVGLTPPGRSLRATSSGRAIRPYFNSGVMTVPFGHCAELRDHYGSCHAELAELLERKRHPVHLAIHLDQVALAVAIASGRIPWAALPVSMNFPCHVPVHASALASSPPPSILHYHGRVDARGFLLRPRSDAATEAADRFNRRRAAELSLPYDRLRRPSILVSLRRALGGRIGRTLMRRHRFRGRLAELRRRRDRAA